MINHDHSYTHIKMLYRWILCLLLYDMVRLICKKYEFSHPYIFSYIKKMRESTITGVTLGIISPSFIHSLRRMNDGFLKKVVITHYSLNTNFVAESTWSTSLECKETDVFGRCCWRRVGDR